MHTVARFLLLPCFAKDVGDASSGSRLLSRDFGWRIHTTASLLLREGKMQGLLEIAKEGYLAKLPVQKGKPLIYVKYIETAPWNIKLLEPKPHYGGIGSRLMRVAVELSLSEDCKGRVGLHSLPGDKQGEPEWFYSQVCKMEPIEAERDGEGLLYFELTTEKGDEFLKGGKP